MTDEQINIAIAEACGRVRQLWPTETFLRSPRCTKPDEGMIDAALIAEYGRIKKL